MQFLIMVIAMLFSGGVVAEEFFAEEDVVRLVPMAVEEPHPCDRYTLYWTKCLRLHEARARAARETLRIVTTVDERGRRGMAREFALVAYDHEAEDWHTIRLTMPLVGNSSFQPVVITPGYQVRRLKGQTFNKMFFQVSFQGRELLVYAAKHLSLPLAFRSGTPEEMTRGATPVVYLATPPYLVNEEFARAGQETVLAESRAALAELSSEGVMSRAYPGRPIAEVSNEWVPLHLVLAEQTDPCLLKKRSLVCQRLIPVNPFQSDEEVMRAVLVEFVLNGHDAFRYLVSDADARGALQFTNTYRLRNGRMVIGTYDAVRREYPQAKLDPDFRSGTGSLRNSLKMAILLIDLELSYAGTPEWVRKAFLEDYRMGLPCPAAAYNGGAQQCRKFAALFAEYRKHRSLKEISFHTFPGADFLSWAQKNAAALNPETHGYLEKIWSIFLLFERAK